jgi:hypothetical protein
MLFENEIKTILTIYIPPFMLVFGVLGNTFCLIVYNGKRFKKFPLRFIFMVLSISDSVYLLFSLSIDYTLTHLFKWDPRTVSFNLCILLNYFGYLWAPLSAWLIVYISVERYISISAYFHGFNKLKQKNIQAVYFFTIILFNCVYYSPILFIFNLEIMTKNNDSISKTKCYFVSETRKIQFAYMDLINSTLIPATIMLLSTILIIKSIFESSSRIFKSTNNNVNAVRNQSKRRMHKDIKFSVTSIFLNIIFITLNLPYCIIFLDEDFTDSHSIKYLVGSFLFYIVYCINFYLFLIVNSTFRAEFFEIFSFRKNNNNFNSNNNNNLEEFSFDFQRRKENIIKLNAGD